MPGIVPEAESPGCQWQTKAYILCRKVDKSKQRKEDFQVGINREGLHI